MAIVNRDKYTKIGDIGFQCASNVISVKWFDNRGVTMIGNCLEECNKMPTVKITVKGQSAKMAFPCTDIVKDYNFSMGGVYPLEQKAVTA